MLDSSLLQQLKGLFAVLENTVTLKVTDSNHVSHQDCVELVQGLASTSPKIRVEFLESQTAAPEIRLYSQDKFSGILFRGVPGGHEFSSLVLAILFLDGKGKQPDEFVKNRIRLIRGPVRVKTYMSLSCENCPEVVQAINLMASIHPDFTHEVIDGAVATDEVEALKLQGVPAVVVDGVLIHSGKSQLLELIEKLEHRFGADAPTLDQDLGSFDVVVIGGGPAGVSAAIYSARKGLSTAIIAERMGGQLQETKGIENMISVPYTEGPKLAAELNLHLSKYPVRLFEHRRVKQVIPGFEGLKRIELETGESLRAQSLIVASGAKWRQLGIPGEKEHIGMGVAFCAHCDGPFFKDKRVVVVGGGNSGVEAAIDLANIASEVTLLEYNVALKADQVLTQKLTGLKNVKVILEAKSSRVIGDGSRVLGIEYLDRKNETTHVIDTDGIFVQIGLLPNSQFLNGLVQTTPFGEIVIDHKGRTSSPGIYAAGDVTTVPFKQIIIAMGEGAKAALSSFEDRMRAQ